MIFFILACSSPKNQTDSAQAETEIDVLAWDLWENGPYAVGYQKWDHSFSNPAGDNRTIPMNIWYPTEDSNGDDVYYYGSPDELSFGDAEPMAPVLQAKAVTRSALDSDALHNSLLIAIRRREELPVSSRAREALNILADASDEELHEFVSQLRGVSGGPNTYKDIGVGGA